MFSGHGNQETQIFELEALKEFYLCFLKKCTSHPGHTRCKYFNQEVILRARIVWPEELIVSSILCSYWTFPTYIFSLKKKKQHHSFNRIYCNALVNTFMQTPWNHKMFLYKSLLKSIFIFISMYCDIVKLVLSLYWNFPLTEYLKNIDIRYSKTSTEHRSTEWKWKLQLPVI